MAICLCESGINNTGTPDCLYSPDFTVRDFLVPIFNSSGGLNSIAVADATDLSDAYITAKINAADWRDRWYPIGDYSRVEDVRAEDITADFDGVALKTGEKGVRTFGASIIKNPSDKRAALLNQVGCFSVGVFKLDKSKNLQGEESTDKTVLFPLRIQDKSFGAQFIPAVPSGDPALIRVTYAYDRIIEDSKLSYIPSANIGDSIKTIDGLKDVEVIESVAPTTETLTVKLWYRYGAFGNQKPLIGAGTDELILKNLTVGDEVTTTITETSDGVYAFDYSGDAQTVADVLRVESKVTTGVLDSTGFEIIKVSLTPAVSA